MLTAIFCALIAILGAFLVVARALWLQAKRIDLRALEGRINTLSELIDQDGDDLRGINGLQIRIETLEREKLARESELEEVRTHYMNHLKRLSAMIARAERLPERKDAPQEKSDFDLIQERRRGFGR